ncbi:cytochrome c(L), periplasmic [Methylotenera versatilis]|uniref:cytochrome c(L), periplasmic n=1 Tax=Methylotenera versatilis TaxID=1055487 RepID=UPI000648969F|nr:cytochrome c(L), periplasmic [Methylotenera versatilis]
MFKGFKSANVSSLLAALLMMSYLSGCNAAPQSPAAASADKTSGNQEVKVAANKVEEEASGPQLDFRGTISGETLDFNDGKGPDSPAVKKFKVTGHNPYNEDKEVINRGYTIFATACSGCHGHLAEGKLGPALADDYWTYPKNLTDKGLFETLYGGAEGMMGPQKGLISQDEMLQIMSWIRSVYSGDPKKAKWLKKD